MRVKGRQDRIEEENHEKKVEEGRRKETQEIK